MKIKLKRKVGMKNWRPVKAEELKGKSLIQLLCSEPEPMIAACYFSDDETLELVIANFEDLREHYQDKDVLYVHSDDLQVLLASDPIDKISIEAIEGIEFIEMKRIKENSAKET